MRIEYLGHACFCVTAGDGTRLVTDPYEAGGFDGAIGYNTVGIEAEGVTVSHEHADHCHVASVKGDPQVIRTTDGGTVGPFNISGTMTAHDTAGGAERGLNIVFVIEADGLRVAHLGDLGHALSIEQVKAIGPVDVLLAPVGGFYTIDATTAAAVADALGAKVIIPMHYKTDKLGFDISGVQDFLEIQPDRVKPLGSSACEVSAEALPEMPEVWLLDPAR
jgi:L-ascorbate metabolism protein UlaG (beta-lactamase superfamily)